MTHRSNKPNPGRNTQGKYWANPHLANKTHLNLKRVKSASSNANCLECSKPHQIKPWVYSWKFTLFSRHFPMGCQRKAGHWGKKTDAFSRLWIILVCATHAWSCSLHPPCKNTNQTKNKKDTQRIPKAFPTRLLQAQLRTAAHGRWFRASFPLMYCYIISHSVFGLLFGRN